MSLVRGLTMKFALKAAVAALALTVAMPAQAALVLVPGFACSPTTTDPDAEACAGAYDGNLNNTSREADLNAAIDILLGNAGLPPLSPDIVFTDIEDTKDFFDETGGVLSFDDTLFGLNIFSMHFGDGGTGSGDVTILYLFDFGEAGADEITLNRNGFSNSILIGGGAVPEPSTWAMMLLGFGAVGYAIRRRRKPLPQLA